MVRGCDYQHENTSLATQQKKHNRSNTTEVAQQIKQSEFMRPRVKICGLTRVQDALAAIAAGADALGFVFYEPSPRAVSLTQATDIIRQLPPFVTKVGLFVNPDAELVARTLDSTDIDLLQFHGDESASFCDQFGKPYIKAVRVKDQQTVLDAFQQYPDTKALLLDTYKKGVPGGTGERFDWQLIPTERPKPVILAGGLTPDNVGQAVRAVQPYAVDVSGGVEAQKGIKDHQLVSAFVHNATLFQEVNP
jgi:phosphoribosylanthranilate isomerase